LLLFSDKRVSVVSLKPTVPDRLRYIMVVTW